MSESSCTLKQGLINLHGIHISSGVCMKLTVKGGHLRTVSGERLDKLSCTFEALYGNAQGACLFRFFKPWLQEPLMVVKEETVWVQWR